MARLALPLSIKLSVGDEKAKDDKLIPVGFAGARDLVGGASSSSSSAPTPLPKQKAAEEAEKIQKVLANRAWAIAKSPGSQLFMFMFTMWMTGNQLTVFSIFILIPMLTAPIQQLSNFREAFQPVSNGKIDLTMYKAIYIALSLVGLALVFYKVHQLGLLPVTSADWVTLLQPKTPVEHSAGEAGTPW